MLDVMRRHADSWVIKTLLIGVALSFLIGFGAFFYIKDLLGRGERGPDAAIVINGERITYGRFKAELRGIEESMREMYKENFDKISQYLNLEEQAANRLIGRTLVKQEAERLNLKVSDAELRDHIRNFPIFQTNGQFDIKKFKEWFQRKGRRSGITQAQFLEGERQGLLVSKFVDLLADSVKISDKEIEDEYRLRNEKVNLKYLEINPKDLESDIEVTEEEIKNFFEKDKQKFEIPEKRKVNYIKFLPSEYMSEVQVTENEIKDYYDRNKPKYEEPEQIRARHILIKASPEDPFEVVEEARKRAESILKDVQQGGDFETLAKSFSEDTSNRDQGGDLGYFSRGKMLPEFDNVAFSLNIGETSSELVETKLGFHIIKVEDKKEAYVKTLEEVSASIQEELKKEHAKEIAEKKGKEFLEALKDSGNNLQEYAKANNIEVMTTEFFDRKDPIPGIIDSWLFSREAFNLSNVGEVSELIKGSETYYILELKDKTPPRIPELDEVKDEVKKDLLAMKSKEKAKGISEEIVEKIKSKEPLEDIAKSYNYEIKETGLFTKRGAYIPQIGSSEELKRDAFLLSQESPYPTKSYEIGGKYIVPVLKERENFEKAKFEKEKESLKEELINKKRDYIIQSWIDRRREASKIEKHFVSASSPSPLSKMPIYSPGDDY